EQECRALLNGVSTGKISPDNNRKLRSLLKNIFVEKHKYAQAEQLLLDMAAEDRAANRTMPLDEDARTALIVLYFSWGEQKPEKWTLAGALVNELEQEREVNIYDRLQLMNLRAFLLRTQHQYHEAEVIYRDILANLPTSPALSDHLFNLSIQYNRALNLC